MEHSAVYEIFASQLSWIGRFVVALGVLGLGKWWLQEVIGLDIEKDVNYLEVLLKKAAEDGDVVKALPLCGLLAIGLVAVAFIISGFVH